MRMSNGFLSQEEINSLINGELNNDIEETKEEINREELLNDIEKDILGEVGNISMGSAATALYQLVNQKVNITTPVVNISTLREIQNKFTVPNILLDVEYTSGIDGRNILMMKMTDAAVIANLMMGGDGVTNVTNQLTEIEISAVQESMNQMIGSSATSMATMLMRKVDISPPQSTLWQDKQQTVSYNLDLDEPIIQISFTLEIGNILTSSIMQVLSLGTAKKIVAIMMGEEVVEDNAAQQGSTVVEPKAIVEEPIIQQTVEPKMQATAPAVDYSAPAMPVRQEQPMVEVQQANFATLQGGKAKEAYGNIDLILDVPLEISVVLGRSKKTIKDILNLGTGSLIELDKLADEPVEVLVNNKTIATGEVVVVDENFGIRITSIVSDVDRVKSLK